MGAECASQAKACLSGQLGKGAEAGESLLSKVNDKFSDKMEEVIDTKLMTKCDDLFDKGINKLVDVTIDKALKSAIKLADKDAKEEEKETKPKQESKSEIRKKSAMQKLKDWGISQILITSMEQDGWLDERIWNELNKEQLQMLGFADGHVALFLRGMEKLNLCKDSAVKLLKEWKISQTLIDNMDDEDYLDESKWVELKSNPAKLKEMGFRSDDIEVFLDEFDKIYEEDDEDINEYGINDYIRYEEIFLHIVRPKLIETMQQKIKKYWTDIKKEDLDNKEDVGLTDEEVRECMDGLNVMKTLQENKMLDRKKWPTITEKDLKGLNYGEINGNIYCNDILMAISIAILVRWGISDQIVGKLVKKDYLVKSTWWMFEKEKDLKFLKDPDAERLFWNQLQTKRERERAMAKKEKESEIILKKLNISEKSIHILRENGLLKKSKWKNIDRKDLKGFSEEEMNIFLKEKERKLQDSNTLQSKDNDTDPTQILKEWGLPSDLINKLKEEGWAHPEYWGDLLDHDYYDLIDLGFRPGHISTFKRQFQRWKEEQDQVTKERKIQLLRKLDSKTTKESSILKRNIDVQNDTTELIRVRIIGERKYDSFKSSSDAAAQHASKASARSSDKSSSTNIKSSKTHDTDSAKTSDKSLDVNVAASGVPVGGAVTVGGSLGVSKNESTTQTNKTHSTQDNERDSKTKAAEARRNQSATGSNTSKAAASQHQWQKVNVGFAEIMPKQIITFPVQISDPNAVVYMTIMVPSTQEKICDNVQIDANFIRVEQVKLEGAVTKIKWQPSVKAPKNPHSRSITYAKQGIITAEGLCDYLRAGKIPVEEWIVSAIQQKLGASTYDINDTADMRTLERHVKNAVSVAVRLNKYDVQGEKGMVEVYKNRAIMPEKDENDESDDEKKEKDESLQLRDLGSYEISYKNSNGKWIKLFSDDWSNPAGYDYTRDKVKHDWFAYVVKKEHRNKKEESVTRRSVGDNEFILIHSDQDWYKIGQRKKDTKKAIEKKGKQQSRNRIDEEEVKKPFNIKHWDFWSLKYCEIKKDYYRDLVYQSEATDDQDVFQYFQLVKVMKKHVQPKEVEESDQKHVQPKEVEETKEQESLYKISTLKDGKTLYLYYDDNIQCLAAHQITGTKFKFDLKYPLGVNGKEKTQLLPTEQDLKNDDDEEENKKNEENEENEKNKKNKKNKKNEENEQLMQLIEMYIETSTKIKSYKHVTETKEDDISDQVIAIANKLDGGKYYFPNEVLQRIYEHKLQNKEKNDGLLDTNKLCAFVKQFNFVSAKKIKFIQDTLDNAKFDIFGQDPSAKKTFKQTIEDALNRYDELCVKMKEKEDDKTITADIFKMVDEYKEIVEDIQKVHKDHETHSKKCQTITSYADYDSDDEELRSVNKFFDVDGYRILKKWELEQFYERMVDEGWKNPLDWVHLDDWILRQNLGFRPGHIQIFNRKYDLWVKKYNDVRRTIPAKRKGKDGVLIVAPGSLKMLEPNHNYEFTKVIVRKNATLTTKSWSPSKREGGVLLIESYQEIVLEEGAKIDVTGKGCWGSVNPAEKGWGPGGTGGGGSVGWFECGAGGGGHAKKGGGGYTPARFRCLHHEFDFETGKSKIVEDLKEKNQEDDHRNNNPKSEKDCDLYHGEQGVAYGDQELSVLHGIDHDKHFDDRHNAIPEAVERHKWALGSGGGYHKEENEDDVSYRGGNGGGALVLICNKLVMYDKSEIIANGAFACNDLKSETRHLCAGGSGGSIYLHVKNDIKTHTKEEVADSTSRVFMRLSARGGGADDLKLSNSSLFRGVPVGIGSEGRIRINYHSPAVISGKYVEPYAYIEEETGGGADQGFDTKTFLQSLKETELAPIKLQVGSSHSYLIQSAKTDEVMVPFEPYDTENEKGTDISRYYSKREKKPVLVCEPWFLYGDQSWVLLPVLLPTETTDDEKVDIFSEMRMRIMTTKTEKSQSKEAKPQETKILAHNGSATLKLIAEAKKEDAEEAVFRFIRIGNKWLIVVMKEGSAGKVEEDLKSSNELKTKSNSDKLTEKIDVLKEHNAYVMKIKTEPRPLEHYLESTKARRLPDVALCSRIELEKLETKHQEDESCLFYVHRYVVEKIAETTATETQFSGSQSNAKGKGRGNYEAGAETDEADGPEERAAGGDPSIEWINDI